MEGDFRTNILQQLRELNRCHSKPFEKLVQMNSSLLEENNSLKEQKSSLEVELQTMKITNEELQSRINQATTGQPTQGKFSYQELESKVFKLQEDLSASYRKCNEKAEELLVAERAVKKGEQEIEDLSVEIDGLKQKLQHEFDENVHLQQKLKEKDATLLVLQREMEALQEDLAEKSKRLEELQRENQQLLERWLLKVSEEAEKMNEATIFYNSMLEDERRRRLLEQAERESAQAASRVGTSTSLLEESMLSYSVTSFLPSRQKRNFEAHKDECNDVSYSHSGVLLATGSNDKSVKLWDSRTGNHKATLMGPVQSIMCVRFSSNDELVLGTSNDHSTRIWHVAQGRVRHTLTGHTGKVLSGTFSGDNQQVITGAHDRTIKVWHLVKGYCVRTIFCLSSCNDICLSSDSHSIYSCHMDGHIRIWDLRSGELAHELANIHSKPVSCIRLNPDGRSLLSSSRDNLLRLIDLRSHDIIYTYKDDNYRSAVNWSRASFSPDGQYIASGGANGSLYVWKTLTGRCELQLSTANNVPITSVAWAPNGLQVVSCDRGGNLSIWE